ncbi:FKBP-type peptidyl-prolyl cis-trans isomerase [Ekhidna sp. To15]|uniref:FKBP-type peptidyl-prolyl cis-trans isomerase n=1 Tax=Ekhidna sp. To15 TaxID=3395267 RepID=UPI003F51C64D
MRHTVILVFVVLLSSCGNDSVVLTTADEEIQAWLDTMNITATRDNSGIYYYADSLNPTGTPAVAGSVAAIYYTLRDPAGNIIAQHQRSNGDSLICKVGASAVYPLGADFGISLMRVGEIYNFILPPDQAYQDLTSGAIDPDLIAHLQITLAAVHAETDLFAQELVDIDSYVTANSLNDTVANPINSVILFPASGISFKRLRAGTGPSPLNGDTIVVDYAGRFIDDSSFGSDSGFEWIYGSGSPRDLLTGFEFAVSLMQTGERALVMIPSSQGYRESALVIPASINDDLVEDAIIPDYATRIAPYSTLLFEITRID